MESEKIPELLPVAEARELQRYLQTASSLVPAKAVEPGGESGWYASRPGGREPWINMSDIAVTAFPGGVILTFKWALDLVDTSYVALLWARGSGSLEVDRWVTQLDFELDTTEWPPSSLRIVGS